MNADEGSYRSRMRQLLVAAVLVSVSAIWAQARDAAKAGRVVVYKKQRLMKLMRGAEPIRSYKIALGAQPNGHKQREGDERTPEGKYVVDRRNRQSRFHLSLHISYPDERDRERAAQLGVSPGGDLFIHGLPRGFGWLGGLHRLFDWTDGCIAVTNDEIEEIWALVDDGTPIEIFP